MLGNDRANEFWAARLCPSEELDCDASPEQRREFITQKYREGRYRVKHPTISSQEELLKVRLTARQPQLHSPSAPAAQWNLCLSLPRSFAQRSLNRLF